MKDISDLYMKATSGEGLTSEETMRMFLAIAERDALIQNGGDATALKRATEAEEKCLELQTRLDKVHATAEKLLPKIERVALQAESSAVKKICGHFREFCESVKDV